VTVAAPFYMTRAIPRVLLSSRSAWSPRPPPAGDIARVDGRPSCLHVLEPVHVLLVLLLPLAEVEDRPEDVERLDVAVLVDEKPGSIPSFHREDAVKLVRDSSVDVLHSGGPGPDQVRPRAEDLAEFLEHPVRQKRQPHPDVGRRRDELELRPPSRAHELLKPRSLQRVPGLFEVRLLRVAIEHLRQPYM
jgi:hypothetical protein